MASAAGVRDKCILGPGANKLARGPDLSQLKPPIKTSLSGTKQMIHTMETGTGEVKNYLLNEINLMYECKTCFSVFRSIANLVSHKRTFCKAKYHGLIHLYQDKEGVDATEMQTVVIDAEPVECVVEQENIDFSNYAPSFELLKTSGVLQDVSQTRRLLPPNKTGLHQAISKLKAKLDGSEESFYQNLERNYETPKPTQIVHLEPMYETENALIQSWKYSEQGETVGQQYRAWQEAEDAKKNIKIGPNGDVTTAKETIKLVSGPGGKTYSVRVPIDAFAENDIDSDDEESGYVKYPCTKCKKTYTKIMNVFNHLVKVHGMTMQEAKNKKKTIQNHATVIEGKNKNSKSAANGEFSNPVKPMEVKVKNYTLNSKVPIKLCEELLTQGTTTCPILGSNCMASKENVNDENTDAIKPTGTNIERMEDEIEEKEKLDNNINTEIDKKIMEYVNRRKVECRTCNQKFSKTLLVKNHVAEEHLKLKRWACTICDFGSWLKINCLTHAEKAHRLRNAESGIVEQSKELYFDKNPLIVTVTEPAAVCSVVDGDCDTNSTHSSSTTVTEDENDHFERTKINGLVHGKGGKPIANVVEGLKSQLLTGRYDDSEESSDGDSEISFAGNIPPSLSPTSNSVSPQSVSSVDVTDSVKRKRSPSSSPRKQVKSVKLTKRLAEDLSDDEISNSSSNTSIISKVMMALPGMGWANTSPTPPSLTNSEILPKFKVPDQKKGFEIVRRVSHCDSDVEIKDLDRLQTPILSTSDSRSSNSSRNSDNSFPSSEVSSKSSTKARSRSRSSSETRGKESNKSGKSRSDSVSRNK